ncbi:MAG: TetR/AcrR family transcriptional regulator [Lachnospiraceae bacterium]|nr:TetR/AcrR family transcriptional regulator [Lachnospiraceae bacterium]
MARNKYPEETRQLILDVSTKLFFEKGYDETSLQDIIARLGGMTKGAIYHHFRSKEEILIAVVDRMSEMNNIAMARLRDDDSLTGKQKLEKMFSDSLTDSKQKDMFAVTPNLMENPKLLVYYIKMVAYTIVPDYIVPVIQQGVKDGSIKTDYPEELADMIMFLTDVWINPIIFQISDKQMINRVMLVNDMLKTYDIELISQEMISVMNEYRKVTDK